MERDAGSWSRVERERLAIGRRVERTADSLSRVEREPLIIERQVERVSGSYSHVHRERLKAGVLPDSLVWLVGGYALP